MTEGHGDVIIPSLHRTRSGHRRLRAAVVAAIALLAVGATAPAPAIADGALPDFTYAGEVTVAENLDYNPTGEFIFPSVFHAGEHLADPLGEW